MFRVVAQFLVMCVAVGSALGATVPREVLWIDKEHVQPMFIPEETLNERSWDELPGTGEMKGIIRFRVEKEPGLKREFRGVPAPQCKTLDTWNEDPSTYPPANFERVLATSDVAVVGRVIDRVPGWSTYDNRVVTMVYVRATEVLRGGGASLQPGDVVIVRELHGDITVRGTRLCVNAQPGYYVTAKGDEVLVAGRRWEGDERFLDTHLLYPVSGGAVASRAFTPIAVGSVALDSVRVLAGEGRGRR